jgi:hypothetical protein
VADSTDRERRVVIRSDVKFIRGRIENRSGIRDRGSAYAEATDVTGDADFTPAESAIIATLQPGSYTAIVHGVNNTTGNALVEVYALP